MTRRSAVRAAALVLVLATQTGCRDWRPLCDAYRTGYAWAFAIGVPALDALAERVPELAAQWHPLRLSLQIANASIEALCSQATAGRRIEETRATVALATGAETVRQTAELYGAMQPAAPQALVGSALDWREVSASMERIQKDLTK